MWHLRVSRTTLNTPRARNRRSSMRRKGKRRLKQHLHKISNIPPSYSKYTNSFLTDMKTGKNYIYLRLQHGNYSNKLLRKHCRKRWHASLMASFWKLDTYTTYNTVHIFSRNSLNILRIEQKLYSWVEPTFYAAGHALVTQVASSLRVLNWNGARISYIPRVCYLPSPAHLPWSHHTHKCCKQYKLVQFLIIRPYPPSCYFFPLRFIHPPSQLTQEQAIMACGCIIKTNDFLCMCVICRNINHWRWLIQEKLAARGTSGSVGIVGWSFTARIFSKILFRSAPR
jgi:hypothetical protein